VLALRLRHEVALHRALRGDSGREGFGGVLLDGEEAETILVAMAGRLRASGTAETLRAIEAMEEALRKARRDPGAIWSRLEQAFGLGDAELDIIFLAAAPGFDPRFGRIFGFLADDLSRRYLTPNLAAHLLERHELSPLGWRRLLADEGPLCRHGLIRMGPDRPRVEAPIRVDEEMLDRLLGATPALPEPPIPSPGPDRGKPAAMPDTALHIDLSRDHRWEAAVAERLAGLAAAKGYGLLPVAARVLSRADQPRDALLSLHRAARLAGACLVVTETETDGPPLERSERLGLLPQPPPGFYVLSGQGVGWRDVGVKPDPATGIPAAPAQQIAALDGLAEPLRLPFDLDDLILPARGASALQELAEAAGTLAVVHGDWGLGGLYGKTAGMTALFKGPSGTGKTMAAQALARRLGMPLYRVDLAGLISKYIGETEKHLNRLFSSAEGLEIVLLFDEADAVFGRRSEVNDAHDRHANTGTAYLLQRLESHSGISILTTNLQDNIDEAFFRRIDAVIDFPTPGPVERRRLWERIRQSAAPLDDSLDLEPLAAIELTGGEIRNCCLTAAYRAAAQGGSIDMETLMRATALELAKKGKPVRRSEFGFYYSLCTGGT
jgi:hypothetical protein